MGVAGFTLGAGISFFAPRYGFVCDIINNFEIVLGNGSVTNANSTYNPDLFKAIKGGSGNLGLVTRFDFAAFPEVDLWGGRVTYSYSDVQKSFQPMIDWIDQASSDPFASVITFWGHNATSNQTLASNLYEYTVNVIGNQYYESSDNPTDPDIFPAPFANFTFDKIVNPLPGGASLGVASLYNLTSHLNLPSGLPNIYAGLTFKATTPVLNQINKVIRDVYQTTYRDPPYTFLLADYQPSSTSLPNTASITVVMFSVSIWSRTT